MTGEPVTSCGAAPGGAGWGWAGTRGWQSTPPAPAPGMPGRGGRWRWEPAGSGGGRRAQPCPQSRAGEPGRAPCHDRSYPGARGAPPRPRQILPWAPEGPCGSGRGAGLSAVIGHLPREGAGTGKEGRLQASVMTPSYALPYQRSARRQWGSDQGEGKQRSHRPFPGWHGVTSPEPSSPGPWGRSGK